VSKAHSGEVRTKALANASDRADGKLGWFDVFDQALQFAAPGRDVSEQEKDLEALEKALHHNPQEEEIGELVKLTRELLKEIKESLMPDKGKMSIAMDAAKEMQKMSIPRLSTRAVEDDPQKNRPMFISDVAAYLPEDTEAL
jgi:hypothetical protein